MSPANENHSIEVRHLATMLAARAMRAALLNTLDRIRSHETLRAPFGAIDVKFRKSDVDAIMAALAQADAAGIESPAHAIAASNDLAKGDAP